MFIVLPFSNHRKALRRTGLRQSPWCDKPERRLSGGQWLPRQLVRRPSGRAGSSNVYDEKYVKWSVADLPILPEKWQYLVSDSTKKQFGILKKLMHRKDVESLICATDAGQCG